jgi:hypothetical protein
VWDISGGTSASADEYRAASIETSCCFLKLRWNEAQIASGQKKSTEIIGILKLPDYFPGLAGSERKNAFRSLRKIERRINREFVTRLARIAVFGE